MKASTLPCIAPFSSKMWINARALLEAGASVESYQLTNTAHLSAEIMKLLVEHGLDALQADNYGRNLFHQILQWDPGPKPELVDYR